MKNFIAGLIGNLFMSKGQNIVNPHSQQRRGNSTSTKGVPTAMPKYYGYRKRPVMVEDKNGNSKLETLKMAHKKNLKIIDTMGIAENLN